MVQPLAGLGAFSTCTGGFTHGRRPPLFPPDPEGVEHPNPYGSTPCGVGCFFNLYRGFHPRKEAASVPPDPEGVEQPNPYGSTPCGVGCFFNLYRGFHPRLFTLDSCRSPWFVVGAMVILPFSIKDNLMITGFILDKSGHYYLSPSRQTPAGRVKMGLRLFAGVGGRSFRACCREPRARFPAARRRACDCRASFRAPSGSAASRWPPAPFGWRASG